MKKTLILPLIEEIVSKNLDISLSDVYIIGVQHILETTHAMFRSLYRLGLSPSNISIIGKCYSTCAEVLEEMLDDGIDVDKASCYYDSHTPFDQTFSSLVFRFMKSRMSSLLKNAKIIIILDDGGKCLSYFDGLDLKGIKVVGVEQTTAGYNAIKEIEISFPIINVARSHAKLKYESPLIAKAAVERILLSLENLEILPKNYLILGAGSIGMALHKHLSSINQVGIYDKNSAQSHFSEADLLRVLGDYDCIVGCTGTTSITKRQHKHLKNNVVLISASSSDREFDAVFLRRCLPKNANCHANLHTNQRFILNSGFPVNFDGERENIDPKLIQLTIALIAAGILQGVREKYECRGLIELDLCVQQEIIRSFVNIAELPKN